MAFADMSDKAIPQPDPIAAQDSKFVKSFQQFTLSNPHPGFGKDSNIINEYGHTKYPMMVYPDGKELPGKIAHNAEEEAALMGHKQDGPTIAEYVAAGYDPSTYPPKGYASKSSDEEIKAAIASHNTKGW